MDKVIHPISGEEGYFLSEKEMKVVNSVFQLNEDSLGSGSVSYEQK